MIKIVRVIALTASFNPACLTVAFSHLPIDYVIKDLGRAGGLCFSLGLRILSTVYPLPPLALIS